MRSFPRLGFVNAALVSCYFAPVWATDAIRVLTSPFNGFEDRLHGTAAVHFRNLFDFNLEGLIRTSQLLAGIKLVIAVAFVAYVIDFARALLMRREPNRETLDIVLLLASSVLILWMWPAFAAHDAALIRLEMTQFLLLTGAMIVIVVERQIEEAAGVLVAAERSQPDEAALAGAARLPAAG
jgi:hypothetical protein